MNNLDKLLDKYEEHFGECFPLMLCRGMDDDEMCKTIQKCLDKNKAYSPALDHDADY